jgi:hypothetical protein
MKASALIILAFWVTPVFADVQARDHESSYHGIYEPRLRQMNLPPEPRRYSDQQDQQDPSEQILGVLIDQGIAGVGLIFLSWFIWKTNGQARADRRELEGRLLDVIKETNKTLVEHGVELQNISRELERIRS